MAIAASVSRNFSLIIILLIIFTKITAIMGRVTAVVVAGKVGVIPAAVKVFGSHVVQICFVELHGDLLKVGAEAPWVD
jgi:hypothetical protein